MYYKKANIGVADLTCSSNVIVIVTYNVGNVTCLHVTNINLMGNISGFFFFIWTFPLHLVNHFSYAPLRLAQLFKGYVTG